ncbi:hypothetical protein V1463_07240 [Micrococcus yunnanensis]|uniref:hypothetical protein n=1 Tax=Micrococcus yunnanensis TaxID=566027 RepID=UPI00300E2ACA
MLEVESNKYDSTPHRVKLTFTDSSHYYERGKVTLRNGLQVKGDIGEIMTIYNLLEHGIAVNSLTASDTGWDLHCHLPDGLFVRASRVGRISWPMSGKSLHIQVKSEGSTKLNVGTVRGWLTGTAVGTPTFLLVQRESDMILLTPDALDEWLREAERKEVDDKNYHAFKYANKDASTSTVSWIRKLTYKAGRFPSVAHVWTSYPAVCMDFPDLTPWMNHEEEVRDPREDLVKQLCVGILASKHYTGDTDYRAILEIGESLFDSAGFDDPEEMATGWMQDPNYYALLAGDGTFSTTSISRSILPFLPSISSQESGEALLRDINSWHVEDADIPRGEEES